MAINVGFEILVDSSVSADKKADILAAVLRVLRPRTLSPVLATTYAAGTTSANAAGIEVNGASEDYGIRVIMDSAVVGTTTVAKILAQLINVLRAETLVLVTTTAQYTAGDRTYNAVVTVT